jgi:hypothetical protein
MRKILSSILFVCAAGPTAFAIIVTSFEDTDTLVRKAKDIVIADCVSIPTNRPVLRGGHWITAELRDGLYKAEVRIIRTLKGGKQPGNQIIATIYPMASGKRYLLYNLGGEVGESGGIPATDFLAVPRLSVVEVPSGFDLKTLDRKELKEQVQSILSRHLFEVECQVAPLLEEKAHLEKVVADGRYDWYESSSPVKIGRVIEASTQTDGHGLVWLDFDSKKLEWSSSQPGKTGFLYFEKLGASHVPYWEFSPCDATKIEDLAGIPLKARFYGMYTPGRSNSKLVSSGLQSIQVSVGKVLLARIADEPGTVFSIQIVGQDPDRDRMSARYAVIQQ